MNNPDEKVVEMLEKLLEKCNDAPSREMAIRHTIIRLLEQREAKDARIKELESERDAALGRGR